jgi:hypothetical protein
MTTRQADQIIRKGQPVTVRDTHFNEVFTTTFVRRDRWHLYTAKGGVYERGDLTLLK